jgi:YteA family regulatory protein
MNNTELEYYRKKLIDEKNNILKTIDDIKEHGQILSQREEIDELSLIDNHPADMAAEMFDKEKRFALLNNEKSIVSQIDDALNRIDNNKYGICSLCGKEISKERLDFMPYAVTCVECENKKPGYLTYRYDRPVEEEVLHPFGKSFRDVSGDMEDEIEYDGEDAWQEVARYEKRPGIVRNFDDIESDDDPESEGEGDIGGVEFVETISNEEYKKQLP